MSERTPVSTKSDLMLAMNSQLNELMNTALQLRQTGCLLTDEELSNVAAQIRVTQCYINVELSLTLWLKRHNGFYGGKGVKK